MDVLRSIVEQSKAHICLSSNWRLDDWGLTQVNKHLRLHDLEPIVGFTHPEEDYFNTRADEVLDYLHKHPEVTHFVVLDDVELNFEDPSSAVPTCIASHSVQTSPVAWHCSPFAAFPFSQVHSLSSQTTIFV